MCHTPMQAALRHQAGDRLQRAGRRLLFHFLQGVQLLPELFRLVQPRHGHGPQRRVVLGQRERAAAGFQRVQIAS